MDGLALVADLIEVLAEHSYVGVFLILIGLNAAPLLMPPTWIVLASFYVLDPALDPLVLSVVGATAATAGRFVLKNASGLLRRFVGGEQKDNLDVIGGFLERRRYGYVMASFLFAATPLPSNMLFVTYGLLRIRSAGIYMGFWAGRVLSYYVMISISDVVLTSFIGLFEDRYVGILVADGMGVGAVVLFASINWKVLITDRRIRFVRPRLWRL